MFAFPQVMDPRIHGRTSLIVGPDDCVIYASRDDMHKLAIALHQFDQAGARLAPALRILRDQLDNMIFRTGREPAPSAPEIREKRKARRDWLADELRAEEEALAAGRAIRADLNPTHEHPAVRAAGVPESPFPAPNYFNQQGDQHV